MSLMLNEKITERDTPKTLAKKLPTVIPGGKKDPTFAQDAHSEEQFQRLKTGRKIVLNWVVFCCCCCLAFAFLFVWLVGFLFIPEK